GLVIANAGLNAIITMSVPVLSALYPITIILVVFGLFHRVIGRYAPRAYGWTVLLVGVFAAAQCVVALLAVLGVALPPAQSLFAALPLADQQLTWLIPAALGLVIGVADSLRLRRR
ncbi:MAG: branched-chain amino acid transport system II carrier protein, partial [Bifidobacterium mongoliense]|nr:branched-chain amino acid transport system II carrier protein [Bifidobacterium mongoliense]